MIAIITNVEVQVYGNKWEENLIYPQNEEMHFDRNDN